MSMVINNAWQTINVYGGQVRFNHATGEIQIRTVEMQNAIQQPMVLELELQGTGCLRETKLEGNAYLTHAAEFLGVCGQDNCLQEEWFGAGPNVQRGRSQPKKGKEDAGSNKQDDSKEKKAYDK